MENLDELTINLDELTIGVSPLTNNIYAGFQIEEGVFQNKTEVTEEVISAVAKHMDDSYKEIDFPAGKLKWEPKESNNQ